MHRLGAGHKTILRMIDLSQQDKNLAVTMRASVWLAHLAGFTPPLPAAIPQSSPTPYEMLALIHSRTGANELVAQLAQGAGQCGRCA